MAASSKTYAESLLNSAYLWHDQPMTERLDELGAEFRKLRTDSARTRRKLADIRARLKAIRPEIETEIANDLRAGRGVLDIAAATGYHRDLVRRIRNAHGIPPKDGER